MVELCILVEFCLHKASKMRAKDTSLVTLVSRIKVPDSWVFAE